jgi:predicted permease
MGWFRRLRSTLSRDHADDAFDEEAQFHLEQRIAEAIARGVPADQARREAGRRFGNLTLTRERTHDEDSFPWLTDAMQDLRFAWRQMRRSPGHALTVVLILAIAIGVNTALFGVVDELLLRRLPVHAPQDLVLFNWLEGRKRMRVGMDGVRTNDVATGRSTSTSFSYRTFLRLRESNQTLVELFAFAPIQQLNTVVRGSAEIASGQYVSGNYFRGLGIEAVLGRTLTDADDRPGAAPVATITAAYWAGRLDRDPRIVGQSVMLNRTAFTIVGVTPPGFSGTLDVARSPDFTLSFAADRLLQQGDSDLDRPAFLWVNLMGRLKPGVTRVQSAASLTEPMQGAMLDEWRAAIAAAGPRAADDPTRTMADASSLRGEAGGQGLMDSRRRYAQPLLLLWACGALVLVVACMNLANLQLSRGAARRREMATRLALGAGRGRVVRQLLTESLLLSGAGAVCGLAVTSWVRASLLVWQPWGGSMVLGSALDWRVLAFCVSLAVLTSLLFGLTPALRTTRAGLTHIARRDSGGAPPLTRALMIAQVAVSVVLLVSAALFVTTLRNLRGVEKGFNADDLLLFRVQPQLNGYGRAELATFYARATSRIEAIPGVRSVTVSRHPLLSFSHRADGLSLEGARTADGVGVEINIVAPSFFQTLEIPLRLGRPFTDRDTATAPLVAIVNEQFVATHFAGSSPIGRRFWLGKPDPQRPIEIVGVARDAKYTDLRTATKPAVYLPLEQDVPGQASFAVRTAGPPLALAAAVREAIRTIDPGLPLFDVRSQVGQAQESVAKETLFARLSTLFGAIALVLVAVGLYGTLSYAVARRTAEIGVRMALGARRVTVVGMIVREAAQIAGIGLAIGVPVALAASHALRSVLDQVLFGLSAMDPRSIAGAALVLLVVALLAGAIPARRAASIDPLVALRVD